MDQKKTFLEHLEHLYAMHLKKNNSALDNLPYPDHHQPSVDRSPAIFLPSGDQLNYTRYGLGTRPAANPQRKTIRQELSRIAPFYNNMADPKPIPDLPQFRNEFAEVRIKTESSQIGLPPPLNLMGHTNVLRYCKFCKKSGETPATYLNHQLSDCPILIAYYCTVCGTKGHTRSYCPIDPNAPIVRQLSEHNKPTSHH